jgi:hypothetical protein
MVVPPRFKQIIVNLSILEAGPFGPASLFIKAIRAILRLVYGAGCRLGAGCPLEERASRAGTGDEQSARHSSNSAATSSSCFRRELGMNIIALLYLLIDSGRVWIR